MENILKEISQDGKVFLNQHYRNIIYKLRFPQKEQIKEKVDVSIKELLKFSKNIRIQYDKNFEKNFLTLEADISSQKDILHIKETLNNENFRDMLLKVIKNYC